MIFDDIFINNLPTLDLHGEIKDSARVLIKEFIYDNYVMRNKKVVIIHGIGKGKIKEEVILWTTRYSRLFMRLF